MQQIVVHEMYFVVHKDSLEKIAEFPRVGYPSIVDASRAQDGRPEYEVVQYHYLWQIIRRNLDDLFIQNM